jgi:hypothetical protein
MISRCGTPGMAVVTAAGAPFIRSKVESAERVG